MKITVFSDGPVGATAFAHSSPADVHIYADRLVSAGHRNVRVGVGDSEAIPYEEWQRANLDNMPSPATTHAERFARGER